MYIPRYFEVADQKKILDFIKANSFGQLISLVQGKLFASHIPFLIDREGTALLGHLAKANPQCSIDNQEVLVTFQGAHGYISPSWYNSPGVPTWNYQAVHVYGRCRVTEDARKLEEIVDSLTESNESRLETPWVVEYSAAKLRGIVGIEVEITDIECKFKLSQNRSEEDRAEVIRQLESNGFFELASAMADNER